MNFIALVCSVLLAGMAFGVTMPDPKLTPGAVFPTVTNATTCVPGYSGTVRNVTDEQKKEVCLAYGIKAGCPGPHYEIDHWVSLTLGGSNDSKNLWPQPRPEANWKDVVEFSLHLQVCNPKNPLSIAEAQARVKQWWLYSANARSPQKKTPKRCSGVLGEKTSCHQPGGSQPALSPQKP